MMTTRWCTQQVKFKVGASRIITCFVSSIWYPVEVTLFHHGSTYDICDENTTFSDVEYSNWYCPSPEWGYPVSLFGMIITAISMSFRTGLPSKLTAQWFEPNEYDIANSMASLADPLGTMIACLFAPFIAKEPSDLLHLQIYFAIPVFLSFAGSLLIRREGNKNEVNEQSFKEMVAIILHCYPFFAVEVFRHTTICMHHTV